MRTDGLYLAAVAAYVPTPVPVAEAVANGWYDPVAARDGGWLGAATAAADDSPARMALRVAAAALARAGAQAPVDVLFYASSLPSGPYGWPPSHYLARRLLPDGVPAVELRQGCCGVLTGLELGACYLTAQAGRHTALVVGAENFTCDPAVGLDPAFRWRYASGTSIGRSSVLGDGASALVLSTRPGVARVRAVGSGSAAVMEELYRGEEPLFPPVPGRPVRLGMRAGAATRRDPVAARDAVRRLDEARTALADRTLAEAGVAAADVARVLHVATGTAGYLRRILHPLGIDASRGVLEFGRRVGHLGVNDQVAALDYLLSGGRLGPGDPVLMLATGVGASLACAVVEILRPPPEEHA